MLLMSILFDACVCVCVCMWQDGYILGQLLPLTPPSVKIEIEVFVWWE